MGFVCDVRDIQHENGRSTPDGTPIQEMQNKVGDFLNQNCRLQ